MVRVCKAVHFPTLGVVPARSEIWRRNLWTVVNSLPPLALSLWLPRLHRPLRKWPQEPDMHPPKYKALEEAAAHCVATGNDCLRHCLGMYAMKDTSMAGCADSAFQLVSACSALATLAAVNSEHTGHLAKVVAMVCRDCQKECEKFPQDRRMQSLRRVRVRLAPRNATRLLLNIRSQGSAADAVPRSGLALHPIVTRRHQFVSPAVTVSSSDLHLVRRGHR